MARHTVFVENGDGVHIEHGEFTLCGDSFDIGQTEGEECGDFVKTNKRVITCPRCADIIKLCRNVRIEGEA